MSNLQNKSEIFYDAAKLLHDNNMHAAVAHGAYFSCVQLMKHIWLYSIRKSENDLNKELRHFNKNAMASGSKTFGVHEFLINNIGSFIKSFPLVNARNDFRTFNNAIWQLKDLRTNADYSDSQFDDMDSFYSLTLANKIMPILKKY